VHRRLTFGACLSETFKERGWKSRGYIIAVACAVHSCAKDLPSGAVERFSQDCCCGERSQSAWRAPTLLPHDALSYPGLRSSCCAHLTPWLPKAEGRGSRPRYPASTTLGCVQSTPRPFPRFATAIWEPNQVQRASSVTAPE
jgi:hypothetical protein